MLAAIRRLLGIPGDEAGPVRRPVNYKSYARDALRTGDVLLFEGRGFFSRAIRRMTGSYRSHAAIVVRGMGRVWIVESIEGVGVRMLPLSNRLRDGARVGWFRHAVREGAEGIAPLDEEAIERFALARVGNQYAYSAIARIVLACVPWRHVLSPVDGEPLPRRTICSAFVAASIRAGGRDLVPNRADPVTSPGDIERSALLAYVGELVLESGDDGDAA